MSERDAVSVAPGSAPPRRATISDVAREAGTGKTSISRYLNGEFDVLSPQLRARIEAAIARLDYQPNQMARGLKRGRNRLIGMLVADLTNPYSVEVLQGVEAACHALGYMPLICHAANEIEMERRYLQLLTTYRVEGVIVNALGVREEMLRPVGESGIPTVLVDRRVEGLAADMVGLDNPAATVLATQHLLDVGFTELRFVVQPYERVSSRRQRVEAFEAALAAAAARHESAARDGAHEGARDGKHEVAHEGARDGKHEVAHRPGGHTLVLDLDDDASALAALDHELDRFDASASAQTQSAALDASPGRLALLAANAPVAMRLALHLHARYGATWQTRVALLSIDDPEWAELAGITTVRQPTYDIGYRAVEFLHERIAGHAAEARDCLLPGELVVRASTAAR